MSLFEKDDFKSLVEATGMSPLQLAHRRHQEARKRLGIIPSRQVSIECLEERQRLADARRARIAADEAEEARRQQTAAVTQIANDSNVTVVPDMDDQWNLGNQWHVVSKDGVEFSLGNAYGHANNGRITFSSLLEAVCTKYGVNKVDLLSARRTKNLIQPRCELGWLCKRKTLWSLPLIGRMMRKDHTSVLYYIIQYEQARKDKDDVLAGQKVGRRWFDYSMVIDQERIEVDVTA